MNEEQMTTDEKSHRITIRRHRFGDNPVSRRKKGFPADSFNI